MDRALHFTTPSFEVAPYRGGKMLKIAQVQIYETAYFDLVII